MAVDENSGVEVSGDAAIEELHDWLAENWDPDLTVGDWWQKLGLAGWSAPGLPTNAYGRGLPRADAVRAQNAIAEFGALGAPGGLGLLLAAPTIATHGTQEQIDLYVRDIVTGRTAWCQLFSEPGAGSDLAGLTCKAERDGDEWIVNGQKVWTSMGQYADLGMLIARTSPDAPKHQGITWFAMSMLQDGVEVRPLVEMTGHAMFNEVFLNDARVEHSAVIGELNGGWAVTNSTLMFERAGLGAGGGSASVATALPGTVAGQLDRAAGEFVSPTTERPATKKKPRAGAAGVGALAGSSKLIRSAASANGSIADPTIRQDLVRLHVLGELGRLNAMRAKAARAAGRDVPGLPNISKLQMSDTVRLARDLGLRVLGASGTLHGYNAESAAALDEAAPDPARALITAMALFAQGPPIYGGTDQIQRNIIGERVLGLPKEPNNDKTTPFSELPKNA